jgi:hypothetical protein
MLRLPTAAWHMWDGKIPEGCGVNPDLTIPLDRSRLGEGIDNQLAAAVDTALDL